MIERYSRPEMKRVWSDDNKFDKSMKGGAGKGDGMKGGGKGRNAGMNNTGPVKKSGKP